MAASSRMTGEAFPPSRLTVLRAVAGPEGEPRDRAWDALVGAYWRPVYTYLRLRWREDPEDARDITQEFFLRAMEGDFFRSYDPARARFRTFLRTCVDRMVANRRRDGGRLKRGGHLKRVSLDFREAEGALALRVEDGTPDPETLFRHEWVRSLLELAVEDLRRRCDTEGREAAFELFRRYDLEAPASGDPVTYGSLAREMGIKVTDVTNWLAWARRTFRVLLLERLRELTSDEEEFREEVRELLGDGAA